MYSIELELELRAQASNDDPEMRFVPRCYDAATNVWLPTPEGETLRADAAEARAEAEARARAKAEARAEAETTARAEAEAWLQALEAELQHLRGQ